MSKFFYRYQNFKDFNNKSVSVTIEENTFSGYFSVKENQLLLNILIKEDNSEEKKFVQNFKMMCAHLSEENLDITLLNCCYTSFSLYSKNVHPMEISYKIDFLLLGYALSSYEDKIIMGIVVSFHDISSLIKHFPYAYDQLKGEVSTYCIKKQFPLPNKTYILNLQPSYEFDTSAIKIVMNTSFSISFNKEVSIQNVLKSTIVLKNLFLLLSRTQIDIISREAIINDGLYLILNCKENEEELQLSKNKLDVEEDRDLKMDVLENFHEVLDIFDTNYERFLPILELYSDVVRYQVPVLTRFVNAITMVEYYAREFEFKNALGLTNEKKGKELKKDADFIDMVKSLIVQVNDVYHFKEEEIDVLSKKVKDARTYYVHYVKNGLKLNKHALFCFVHFLEDLVLLNIYKFCKMDIAKFSRVSFYEVCYTLKDLIDS